MSDVTDLLGLHGEDRNSFYVRCPCCDTEKGKHLNINLKKEVFRCARCGEAGGIFDLYALFTGTPREQARRAIIERIGVYQPQIRRSEPEIRPIEKPLAPVAARHKTYMGFLSVLSLSDEHRENLRNRGLSDSAIARLGYKSMPMGSGTALARRLEERGLQLSGVPGFFRTHAGEWSFVHQQEGILVPVRDIGGQIQGLQVRLDNTTHRKFRWISSGTFSGGCKAQGWVHLAGEPKERVILTEGPMKADVINALTGLTVLAVPGVNALTKLEEALSQLRQAGLQEVKTAFDMDYCTNWCVQKGYNNLLRLLARMGFRYGTYVWDPRYKGLDDFIWTKLKTELEK